MAGSNEENDTSTQILLAIFFLLKAELLVASPSFFTLQYYLSVKLKAEVCKNHPALPFLSTYVNSTLVSSFEFSEEQKLKSKPVCFQDTDIPQGAVLGRNAELVGINDKDEETLGDTTFNMKCKCWLCNGS